LLQSPSITAQMMRQERDARQSGGDAGGIGLVEHDSETA
jgi:hypothetical protein